MMARAVATRIRGSPLGAFEPRVGGVRFQKPFLYIRYSILYLILAVQNLACGYDTFTLSIHLRLNIPRHYPLEREGPVRYAGTSRWSYFGDVIN